MNAWDLLTLAFPETTNVQIITIVGPPHAKARPRLGRGHSYAPDRDAEDATRWLLKSAWCGKPLTGGVALACDFYVPTSRRVDADNLLKHICDAGNGTIWRDDAQITAILATVEYDPTHPRTLLAVGDYPSALMERRLTAKVRRR